MLDKSMWLAKTEVDGDWPCWGLIDKLHMDNAKEFRGNMIKKACQQYGIEVEWRPVARPHFGAHIERYLGTMAREIHNLQGTTFSNVRQRGEYNSEGKAVMTLPELEAWITEYIVNYYHHQFHSGIDSTPFARYQKGILGDATTPGKGLPRRVSNPERFRLDFMPYIERTVQPYGVVIDDIYYFHDVLRRWVNAKDPSQPKLKRKFLFRYDPRDISVIWFYDPETTSYHKIPYRNTSHPAISVWELRRISAELKKNREVVDETRIFAALKRLKQIEDQASLNTKVARKEQQRRIRHQEAKHYVQAPNTITSIALEEPAIMPSSDSNINWQNIQPFDDLDAGL
jgi:putative transposase